MAKIKRKAALSVGSVAYFAVYGTVYTLSFFFPILKMIMLAYSVLAASIHAIKFMFNQKKLGRFHFTTRNNFDEYFQARENRTIAAHNLIYQGFMISFMYFSEVNVGLFANVFGYAATYALNYIVMTVLKTRSVNEIRRENTANQPDIYQVSTTTQLLCDAFDMEPEHLGHSVNNRTTAPVQQGHPHPYYGHYASPIGFGTRPPPMNPEYAQSPMLTGTTPFWNGGPNTYVGQRPPPINPYLHEEPGTEPHDFTGTGHDKSDTYRDTKGYYT